MCLVVASANPEDYTNRGRIITEFKDRFSEIRTHYRSGSPCV
jgi:Mg-chelatase subunit ChlI